MTIKYSLLILPALALAACSNNDSSGDASGVTSAAVVATSAPDSSSGAVSLALTTSPYTAQNGLDATTSDLSVRADGDHFFLIKSYGTDQIQRYQAAAPTVPVYTYSTQDPSDTTNGIDSNPYDLVVLSETKGYLIRYGSSSLWIVNPSATTEAAFKIGQIDLSAYAVNGAPQMSAGLIKNGKLYVAMQRLDSDFAATQDGYVAVIDTTTDQEITTGSSDAALKGIDLQVHDPIRLQSVPGSDAVLVAADGGYDGSFNKLYGGGVVSIDPDHGYATTLLVPEEDSEGNPLAWGDIADFTVAAADRAYFVGSTGYHSAASLYRFNPTTNAAPVAVTAVQNLILGPISADASGNVWVGQLQTQPSDPAAGLIVVGFANGGETIVKQLIGTTLNPLNIDFVSESN